MQRVEEAAEEEPALHRASGALNNRGLRRGEERADLGRAQSSLSTILAPCCFGQASGVGSVKL